MHLHTLSTLIALLALFTTTLACKCWASKDHHNGWSVLLTRECCDRAGGFTVHGDCNAHSMPEALDTFWMCCRKAHMWSDCNCPFGCGGKMGDGEGDAETLEGIEGVREGDV